jgi:hypothetical protein
VVEFDHFKTVTRRSPKSLTTKGLGLEPSPPP